MRSLDEFAKQKLGSLSARHLRRQLWETRRLGESRALRAGRQLISFSCNDYLNLGHHPAVIDAARRAIAEEGVGAGASRLVTGHHPLHRRLEERLAAFKGSEDALVVGSGYLANVGVIPSLVGPRDVVFADEWSHACLLAGSRLSQASLQLFRHNDVADLASRMAAQRDRWERCLVLTDGIFSMDGDLAPLPALATLCRRYDAWLLVDDAHALGVIGGARGSAHAHGRPVEVPLQMGTLSKALGSYGGYLCASRPVVELMQSRARTVVYSTGLPPALAAAGLAALEVLEADAERCARPLRNAQLFASLLSLPEPQSAIVPVVLGEPAAAMAASAHLLEAGFLVAAIRPPTVPDGTARLRFAFTAAHTSAVIHQVAECLSAFLDPPQPVPR